MLSRDRAMEIVIFAAICSRSSPLPFLFYLTKCEEAVRSSLQLQKAHRRSRTLSLQYSAKRGRLGCVIPRPGSLWPRGRVHATYKYSPFSSSLTTSFFVH